MLHALSDESRRTVLEVLREHPATVGELASLLPIARPGVSRHLRVRREAGPVKVRQEAQQRVYNLRPEALAELDAWLGRYRVLWEERLDALHTEVARGKHARRERQCSRAPNQMSRIVGILQRLDNERAAVRVEDIDDTDIDDLWSALTDPSRLAHWIATVEGDLRPGGRFHAHFTSTYEGPGRIDVCEAPRRLLVTLDPGTSEETVIEARTSPDR